MRYTCEDCAGKGYVEVDRTPTCHCPTGKQHVDGCFMSAHPKSANPTASPRRAEEIQTGKEDRRESGTVAGETSQAPVKSLSTPTIPAPSQEPQGSEGQRWALDMEKDGSGRVCQGIFNPGGACTIRKQYGQYHIEVVPSSLLAVAEAKATRAATERDAMFNTMMAKDEALRVAEERAEKATSMYHTADYDRASLSEKLADSERRVKELEAAIVEWDDDEGNWTGLNSCDTLKLIADEILARLSAPSNSDTKEGGK